MKKDSNKINNSLISMKWKKLKNHAQKQYINLSIFHNFYTILFQQKLSSFCRFIIIINNNNNKIKKKKKTDQITDNKTNTTKNFNRPVFLSIF